MIGLRRPGLLHLVIHPDGNIWMVDVVESSGWWKARGGGKLGIALARDAGQPVTKPDEKAEAVARVYKPAR